MNRLEAATWRGHSRPMKMLSALFAAACLIAAPAISLAGPAADGAHVTVTGIDGKSVSLTAADLDAMPQASAGFTHEGRQSSFKGPLLADVLKRVGAPLGPAMRGAALSDVVILTASDGYVVTLALSDLEPSIRAGTTILSHETADGAPLDKDGPFRLIVGDDLKPARSERNVVSIEARQLRPAP